MEEEIKKQIIDEQYFPYINMTLEERNYYLEILNSCQDICDSKFKINNEGKCNIVEMHFKKVNDNITFNGSLNIGNKENRCIDGTIYIETNKLIVDSHITRLGQINEFREYTVLDEFSILKNKIKRRSQYNFDMQSIYTEMKGKTK